MKEHLRYDDESVEKQFGDGIVGQRYEGRHGILRVLLLLLAVRGSKLYVFIFER